MIRQTTPSVTTQELWDNTLASLFHRDFLLACGLLLTLFALV